ncbi:MAG: LiaF domain-containing protein [Ktedonobacterales bacterium]
MDQETAIEILRERYARGGLALEEFRRTMSLLMVTADPVECQAIIDQLPKETGHDVRADVLRPHLPNQSSSRKAHRISAFFGEVNRSGALWELGPETQVSATFGEANLDVRMARLSPGENILRLNALFGEISVTVPEGLHVLVESSARFGEVSMPGREIGGITVSDEFTLGGSDAGSYLRIEALATFGAIKIRTH